MNKIIMLAVAGFLAAMPPAAQAYAPKKGDKECIECHTLDKKDAEEIVKKLAPTGTVTEIKMSPVKGIWQIEVDAGEGKRGALYLDFSKKYLTGQIIPVEAVGKPATPRTVDVSKISLEDAITIGSHGATAKRVLVFSDPDCPYCRELHKSIKQVVAKRNDVAFILIFNPLPMHKDAYRKVQAILCSKSIEMIDDAFAGKPIAEPPTACSHEAVDRSLAVAKALEFSGTPTMVRDDGDVHSGFLPEDKLLEWIDKKK